MKYNLPVILPYLVRLHFYRSCHAFSDIKDVKNELYSVIGYLKAYCANQSGVPLNRIH